MKHSRSRKVGPMTSDPDVTKRPNESGPHGVDRLNRNPSDRLERLSSPELITAAERGHVETGDPYRDLPWSGPHAPELGHALITMVEPHDGHEHTYNRWYEDSHFFNGGIQHPWVFAGRRWVAPHELQQLRFPADSSVAEPVTRGSYLALYWITNGRLDEVKRWSSATNDYLRSVGDVYPDRSHVFTSYHDKLGTVYGGDDVPHDRFALMDPAPGLVLETIDAPAAERRGELEEWLFEEYLPSRVGGGGPVSAALLFRPQPPPSTMTPAMFRSLKRVTNDERRLTILWFLTEDPRDCWDFFEGEADAIHSGGLGDVTLVAPFIPSRMGTTLYEDQLRRHR